MGKSKIDYVDETWNWAGGCEPISPGCAHCAAAKSVQRCIGYGNKRYAGLVAEGKWTGEVRVFDDIVTRPLQWRKARRAFVNFLSDTFHDDITFDFLDVAHGIMLANHLFDNLGASEFLILTKRAKRMHEYYSHRTPVEHVNAWAEAADGYITMKDEDMSFYDFVYSECSHHRKDDKAVDNLGPWSAVDNVFPLPNVWLGVTAENQEMADKRILLLLQTPAAKRFLSIEPMLGAIDLMKYFADLECGECDWLGYTDNDTPEGGLQKIYKGEPDWNPQWDEHDPDDEGVWACPKCKNSEESMMTYYPEFNPTGKHPCLDVIICGGESGKGARPMHPDHPRSMRDQCKDAGVLFYFKQNGEWIDYEEFKPGMTWSKTYEFEDGTDMIRVGKKKAGHLLDGVEHRPEW